MINNELSKLTSEVSKEVYKIVSDYAHACFTGCSSQEKTSKFMSDLSLIILTAYKKEEKLVQVVNSKDELDLLMDCIFD